MTQNVSVNPKIIGREKPAIQAHRGTYGGFGLSSTTLCFGSRPHLPEYIN